jgi:hypothetical protein
LALTTSSTDHVVSVKLENINDVSKSTRFISKITFDTYKEKIVVVLPAADKLYIAISQFLSEFKDKWQKGGQQSPTSQPASSLVSGAEEIFKYKQLLDAGIISQEEFDLKKKQILGI